MFVSDHLPFVLEGALLTVQVGFASLLVALVLGGCGALAKLSNSKILRGIMEVYTTIIRGIPDLVLMLLLYFGGQVLINQIVFALGYDTYIELSAFWVGVITIGFIFGAYMTETFRGALLAVSKGQIEAGFAYGMTGPQVFFRITLPQALRHALPGLSNNWLVQLKTTALVSVIGLNDMVFRAKQAGQAEREPFTFLLAVAVIFLLLTGLSEILLNSLSRYLNRGFQAPKG
ncbi:MAG: ABC transporter permease [Pseudomonadota bacterium]